MKWPTNSPLPPLHTTQLALQVVFVGSVDGPTVVYQYQFPGDTRLVDDTSIKYQFYWNLLHLLDSYVFNTLLINVKNKNELLQS